MNKYINADRLKVTLLNFADRTEDMEDVGIGIGVHSCIHCLDEMPAADVVEVIRCKDCKHSVINHGRYCVFGDCLGCLVADDFFCKFGER